MLVIVVGPPAAALVFTATLMVKLNVPDVVFFPERTPSLVSVRPGGNEPLATDQLYGAKPPVAPRLTAE